MPDFATLAGHLVRFLMKFGLGLAGAICVVIALGSVDWRLGVLAAGVAMLILDRKVP